MIRTMKVFAVLLSVLLASEAMASSSPRSLQLKAYLQTPDGGKLALYQVNCSTRDELLISKTVGEPQWCAGANCYRDKIAAAQQACKSGISYSVEQLADINTEKPVVN